MISGGPYYVLRVHKYICVYIHVYIYIHMYIYIYMYTHPCLRLKVWSLGPKTSHQRGVALSDVFLDTQLELLSLELEGSRCVNNNVRCHFVVSAL